MVLIYNSLSSTAVDPLVCARKPDTLIIYSHEDAFNNQIDQVRVFDSDFKPKYPNAAHAKTSRITHAEPNGTSLVRSDNKRSRSPFVMGNTPCSARKTTRKATNSSIIQSNALVTPSRTMNNSTEVHTVKTDESMSRSGNAMRPSEEPIPAETPQGTRENLQNDLQRAPVASQPAGEVEGSPTPGGPSVMNSSANTTSGPSPHAIIEISLNELQDTTLDIGPRSTRKHLRMIDCRAYIDDQLLRVYQFDHTPTSYAVISYIWKGNGPNPPGAPPPETQPRQFRVKGAEDGDPISMTVLGDACLVAAHHGIPYIWLDQVCIIQRDKEDKSWQILRMFQLYKGAALCVIFPGGLERLLPLDEETAWMHRAWTLQEAMAPSKTMVAFSWDKGGGVVHRRIGRPDPDTLEVIVPGHLAIAPLTSLADACFYGDLQFISSDEYDESHPTWFSARGKAKSGITAKLLGYKTPNLATLISAVTDVHDGASERAIWQCALGRTSSRPVDMVLSIMGLFGVALNPTDFHRDDRIGATIALARAILRKGGDGSWVGTATRMRPCAQLSHFPEFPRTTVAGRAEVVTPSGLVEAVSLVDADEPDGPRITGEMDGAGYLTLDRQACAAVPVSSHQGTAPSGVHEATAVDGTRWHLDTNLKLTDLKFPRTAAIFLGTFYDWRSNGGEASTWVTKFMLVVEHERGRFHAASYIVIDEERDGVGLFEAAMDWEQYSLAVGGPQPLTQIVA